MKLWIDDELSAPVGYVWCKTVNGAINCLDSCENIIKYEKANFTMELIDIDHDAGKYAKEGGNYIRFLEWLEETGRNYPIRIHGMNSEVVAEMREIIKRNNWKEVY